MKEREWVGWEGVGMDFFSHMAIKRKSKVNRKIKLKLIEKLKCGFADDICC